MSPKSTRWRYCDQELSITGYLIGAQQDRLWDREPKGFGSFQIDDELELGRLLYR